eukprot:PhF_6_TR10811/c0_g1_i1/m.17418
MNFGTLLLFSVLIVNVYALDDLWANIFFGNDKGYLFRVRASTGQLVWKSWLGGKSILSTPDVTLNHTLFVGDTDTHLYAVNTSDGKVLWKAKTNGKVHASPAVHRKHKLVYVGSLDNHLYAFSIVDGTMQWRFKTDGPIHSGITFSRDKKRLYFGGDDGYVYSLYTQKGLLDWKAKIGDVVYSTPFYDAKHEALYVTSFNSHMYSLDARRGDIRWKYQAKGGFMGSPIVITPPDSENMEGVCAGSEDKEVHCVFARDGKRRWTYTGIASELMTSPAYDVSNHLVFVSSLKGEIIAISDARGAQQWRIQMEYENSGTLMLESGLLFIPSHDKHIHCLLTKNGNFHWKLGIDGIVYGGMTLTYLPRHVPKPQALKKEEL